MSHTQAVRAGGGVSPAGKAPAARTMLLESGRADAFATDDNTLAGKHVECPKSGQVHGLLDAHVLGIARLVMVMKGGWYANADSNAPDAQTVAEVRFE
jgi:hypothetical protein